jgi:hypothetical protein
MCEEKADVAALVVARDEVEINIAIDIAESEVDGRAPAHGDAPRGRGKAPSPL